MPRLVALLLALAGAVGLLTASPAAAGGSPRAFCDVRDSDYFADAVTWAKSVGITSGVSPTAFDPGAGATRGQMVTLLHRYIAWRDGAVPPAPESSPFTDLAPGAYYEEPVRWAAAAAVTTGVSPTRFDPMGPTTRAQLATLIHRLEPRAAATAPAPFDDVPAATWYSEAVAWMAETGLTTGTGPRTFSPDAASTRAEVITFLWRLSGQPAAAAFDPAACPRTFAAIGDSVMWGAGLDPNLAGWVGVVDVGGCRQALETVADTTCGKGDILSTLAVLQRAVAQRTLGEVVIIHVGTNGPLTADAVDQLVAAAAPADTIWFVTVRSPWSNQIAENAIIAERVAAWSETHDVRILDWYARVEQTPTLVGADGIHLSSTGRVAYTEMIRAALAAS